MPSIRPDSTKTYYFPSLRGASNLGFTGREVPPLSVVRAVCANRLLVLHEGPPAFVMRDCCGLHWQEPNSTLPMRATWIW